MTRKKLAKQIKIKCLLKGNFILRSGLRSNFYWDKFRFENDPAIMAALVIRMAAMLPCPRSFDQLAGLELGGVSLAAVLSLKTKKPLLQVRKQAKEYGTCNLIEGGFRKGEKVVIIEDVITTAGQVCESINQARELGLEVIGVLCVIDREQGGRKRIEELGCWFKYVFTQKELDKI